MVENALKQLNTDVLQQQLDLCSSVTGKLRNIVESFLYLEGIYTLDDVNMDVNSDYKNYIDSMVGVSANQRKYYKNLLEQVLVAYFVTKNNNLADQVGSVVKERAIRNKVLFILVEQGVQDCSEIDYEIRTVCEKVLLDSGCTKPYEYLRAIDSLKLDAIRRSNEENPLRSETFTYNAGKVFLLYHPDYSVGMTFYYIRDKKELLFDFSLKGSEIVKRQIFKMLCYVLKEKKDRHVRRERFIIPLKRLYLFCLDQGIEDIELLTEKQIEAFRLSMDGKVGTKTDIYMQIVYNTTKYLFVTAKNINWDANIWYLERLNFNNGRTNPAHRIEKISFGHILDDSNRAMFKGYMRYELSVASRTSLQTIRCQYYDISQFLKYCDEKGWKVSDIDAKKMERYITSVDSEDIKAEAYNRRIISIARLFSYLKGKHLVKKEPLHFEYYFKTVFTKHNNRTVSAEDQKQILMKLKYLPLTLRLMFLNLWCEGIRGCEVCAIKAGMYSFDGRDAWLKLYQNKMKKEKNIPIPYELYKLMQEYIKDNGIKTGDYVFQNRKGGAYDAATFTKQMKRELKKAGLTEYDFKAHDFRHTIGTAMNRDYNVSIEVIRDFLGHNSSDMTKQYIDFVPEMLDAANEDYFAKEENRLTAYTMERKEAV